MLLSLLLGEDPLNFLISLILTFPIAMLALAFHETAHGYVAWKCGDPTAYNLGRLTLNPLKHIDPMGFLMMILFGYGWAKAVPINTRNFRNPKWGMALSALAGPAANLLLGLVSAVLFGVCRGAEIALPYLNSVPAFVITAMGWLSTAFWLGSILNFTYMVFNLIPVPPFDGSRIALVFLPPKAYFGIMRYERQIMFGILIFMFALSYLGYSPFSWIAQKLTTVVARGPANAVFKAILS